MSIKLQSMLIASVMTGVAGISPAIAATCSVPNVIANGQVADASKVMENFNAVAACAQGGVTATGAPTVGALPVFTNAGAISSGNLTGDVTTAGGMTTTLSNSGVTPGVYLNANITVDSKGRVTGATSGNGGSGGGAGGTGGLTLVHQYIASGADNGYNFIVPSQFMSLEIEIVGRSTAAAVDNDAVVLTFNSDTGANYRWVRFGGTSSGPINSSSSGANNAVIGYLPAAASAAGSTGSYFVRISNYLTSQQELGDSSGHGVGALDIYASTHGFSWNSTSIISGVQLKLANGNLESGSIVRLWGRGSSAIPAKYGSHRYWRMNNMANSIGINNMLIAEMRFLDYYGSQLAFSVMAVDAMMNGAYGGSNINDGTLTNIWAAYGPSGHSVSFDFGVAVDPRTLLISIGGGEGWPEQGPASWSWDYSDDGATWNAATAMTAAMYSSDVYQNISVP